MTRPNVMPFVSKARYEIEVVTPYRLDLTVSVLRRLSTNIVDVLTPEGQYVRALSGFREPILTRVAQEQPDALVVTLEGSEADPRAHPLALAIVRRMLGVGRELTRFNRSASRIPWLRALAARMRGVKPPHSAASSISQRLIIELGSPIRRGIITRQELLDT